MIEKQSSSTYGRAFSLSHSVAGQEVQPVTETYPSNSHCHAYSFVDTNIILIFSKREEK